MSSNDEYDDMLLSKNNYVAKELVPEISQGRVTWKVKGERAFHTYGIPISPDVLLTIGLTNLDPLRTYDLGGRVAHFIIGEDGRAKKVTRLTWK